MCEYCDHDTNEDAKRFPLFGDNDRDEAFIDEDNYLSVYTKNGDWVGGHQVLPDVREAHPGCNAV